MSENTIDRISSALAALTVAALACALLAGTNVLFGTEPWHVSLATVFVVTATLLYGNLRRGAR